MRELTKKFEQAIRGTLSEILAQLNAPPKGECVIAVCPPPQDAEKTGQLSLDELLSGLLGQGLSVRDAAAAATIAFGVPKKEAYARALALSDKA